MTMQANSKNSELYRPKGWFDLLDVPVFGRIAKMRYGRLVFQAPFLIIAALIVYDGLTGPQRASQNIATVLPWVHYRGVIVLVLLLAGNFFCMGCPFTIPRTLAKRLSLGNRRFPRMLRNKWVSIISLLLIFFVYEWLDLWSSPVLTAWLTVAYFVASFALEAWFGESAFCKYVCPIGAFNFVYATSAPTQITSKNLDICKSCVGKECVNGSYALEPVIRIDQIPIASSAGETKSVEVKHSPQGTAGCGLELFVPQITTNLDCTLCLDCVRACPHDNVALMVRTPGRELGEEGSWRNRWDVAFLVYILGATAILNAFGMVTPVYGFMNDLAETLGLLSATWLSNEAVDAIILSIMFIGFGVLAPVGLTMWSAWLSRFLTRTDKKYSQRDVVTAFAPAFVPMSLGIWIAHYGFHFLIGFLTIIPVFQNFLIDHRVRFLGEPNWTLGGIEDLQVVGVVQVASLLGGFLWSMFIAQKVSLRLFRRNSMFGLIPWALLLLLMAYLSYVIFGFDMEMRGTIYFD